MIGGSAAPTSLRHPPHWGGFQPIDASDHAIPVRELDHTGVPLRFGSATIRFPIAAGALPTLRRTPARSLSKAFAGTYLRVSGLCRQL